MRAWVWAICLGALMLSAQPLGAAETTGASVTIGGRAGPFCSWTAPIATGTANMGLTGSSATGGTVWILNLMDSATSRLLPGSIHLQFHALCNHAHAISMESVNGGLIPLGGAPVASEAFVHHIDYTAAVSWASATGLLQTTGIKGQRMPAASVSGAYAGDVTVDITLAAAGADLPLYADTYSDRLIITLGTQF